MKHILLIEDNREMVLALRQALATSHHITNAASGRSGIMQALHNNFDIILLDLHLPDMTGFEICQILRDKKIRTPIVVLTGEYQVLSKIKLLDAGANDYVTKPFSLGELKARLRAAQRNAQLPAAPYKLRVGDLMLDATQFKIERAGEVIHLRRKEFALLECLMQRAGTVVTREVLSDHAWKDLEAPWTSTIDVHIKRLRDKIDRPFEQPLIHTIHGLGYKIEAMGA